MPHENRDGSRASGIGSGGTKARGFWPKVLKYDGDGCWEWMGYLDKDGYGKFCTVIAGKARTVRPHRYAWELENGPVPDGKYLLHKCDNRKCLRPSHLRPGTQRDNVYDSMAKGRWGLNPADNRGEMSGCARLRNEDIKDIRGYRGVYGAGPLLAQLYGVSVHHIRSIICGRTWRHLRGRHNDPMPLHKLRELVEQRRPKQRGLGFSTGEAPQAPESNSISRRSDPEEAA